MNHIDRAIAIVGTLTGLAEKLGTTPQAIYNWRKRGCPAKRCRDVELATDGQVTCQQLQPDIFGKAA